MSTARTRWRDVHGVVLLDKPRGMSSNHALQAVRRLLRARKAGHTGSLDPLASGMLPVCCGEATRFSQMLLDADKTYSVCARLGVRTDTGDAEGDELERQPVPALDARDWQAVCDGFTGAIQQVPPMYSALKHQGKRLYELARAGVSVDRPARPVTIHRLEVTGIEGDRLQFSVTCSKGTYVRTLVEDLARAAGTVAWTEALHRTGVAPFTTGMHTLEELEGVAAQDLEPRPAWLLPVDATLAALPSLSLDRDEAYRFCSGSRFRAPATLTGTVRCYGDGVGFLGTAEFSSAGDCRSRKVLASARSALEGRAGQKPV